MKTIEKEGKNTSAIIEDFMKEYNLSLDDFKFDVVRQGSSGFLHLFGSKPTKIRFYITDVKSTIRKFAENILKNMDVAYSKLDVSLNNDVYYINIIGAENPGFVIGKEAKLLDSLEYLLNQMINKHEKKQINLRLDTEGYRKRRKLALLEKVKTISARVKNSNKSFTMDPLTSSERKIVHRYIEKENKLRTKTVGKGDLKRIVIFPNTERSKKK